MSADANTTEYRYLVKHMEQEEPFPLELTFNYWHRMIASAYATFEAEELELDGKKQVQETIKFNFTTPEEYEKKLKERYENFQLALENALGNIYYKLEKLNFLSKYLAEAHAATGLLIKDENGRWHHRNFEFESYSREAKHQRRTMDEFDFEGFYSLIDQSLTKMRIYLDNMREDILATPQIEIPIPASMVVNPNSSNAEKPIAFFDWFFARDGLAALHDKFISDSETDHSDYNEMTDACEWEYALDDDYEEIGHGQRFFADKLKRLLVSEVSESYPLISAYIEQDQKHEAITIRIQFLLSSLEYYHKLAGDASYQRYDSCFPAIYKLQNYIHGKYLDFCPEHLRHTAPGMKMLGGDSKTSDQQAAGIHSRRPLPSFVIATERRPRIVGLLLELLKKEMLIARDTEGMQLMRAFDGSELHEPLNIRWLPLGRNKLVSKQSLLYFLDCLAQEKIILEQGGKGLFLKRVELTCFL